MKYRKMLAATALVGLMGITACSTGAYPENNEANYNGERLVRSVTRRADSFDGGNSVDGTNRTRGFTRNISRNANRNARGLGQNRHGTRNYNSHNRHNRHNRDGRMGHTFGYNNHRANTNMAGRGSYGMELNRNSLNNRVYRNDISYNDLDGRFDQTVPVVAIDETDDTANASRVAEFFAQRRNRGNIEQNNTQDPTTLPAPAPQQDDATTLPAPAPDADNDNTTTPEPTPTPGTNGNGVNTRRAMK
ncbi:MAG: hypothetical protein FWB88_02050 [Defluviitaleaceae bacterium]|nr:hypothetical protein [Defluviitaleaceae bacterium]MCL2238874.1 hypothetical protein [Defluviitaleaceae bacterium]